MNKKIILKISLKVISLLYIIGYYFYLGPAIYYKNEVPVSLSSLLMTISFLIILRKEKLVDKEKKYEKTFKILRIIGYIILVIPLLVFTFLEIKTRFY